MLFHGPGGCGKRTAALALAQAVNCPSPLEGGDACGTCANCERIARGIDVDVRYYTPARNEFLREQANEMREEAFISPNTGVKKFLILDAAHRITAEAANLLLKVLEEPPETTVFILLSDNPHLLLPTIKSRSISLTFRPLSLSEMGVVLAGRIDPEALPLLYSVSGADAGRILNLASDTNLGEVYRELRRFLENSLLTSGKEMSPTNAAEKILAFAENIDLGTAGDTEASKARKGIVAALETMLSLLEAKMMDAVTARAAGKKKNRSPAEITALMENILDTIKIITGSGHNLLALENLALAFRRFAAAPR